ncbi:hypothetical protein FM038_011555 [Shewanella eurypsychrophilus]|uniref:Uncharacterized protein n=1 Tax=Shewanella eurypsychrophilus TaxID=2593656 RepID=A0ABX6V8Z8_9GAMM|nr:MULTISPECIES: hypothetical protein [Shewanella]QFU22728.1 hypothetical protein FS418_13135 [Shewanella sp. YLB-09]QPG58017.1 hypothetical protein FM038_011555 [Shewanella eurypsychrophilus]
MSTEAFEIAQAILLSLGGGGVIIFALSSFLGKMWAQRILQCEKSEHDKELSEFKSQLDTLVQKRSLNYQHKIELYKVTTAPLVEFTSLITTSGLTKDHLIEFDRQRLHIVAQLSLFAPQNVFDAFNDTVDYLYDALEQDNYSFSEFRIKVLKFFLK